MGNGKVTYRDDNKVDFSRKKRVTRNNSGVSRKYDLFSSEDAMVDYDHGEFNPSINKKTYDVSDCFEDELNSHDGLLNKGKVHRPNVIKEKLDPFNLSKSLRESLGID